MTAGNDFRNSQTAHCMCDPQPREWFMTNPPVCGVCRLPAAYATPAPFDWATASAEEKVRRRWPKFVAKYNGENDCDVWWVSTRHYSTLDHIGWGVTRRDALEDAANHPSVLELQRRETSQAERCGFCQLPVIQDGDARWRHVDENEASRLNAGLPHNARPDTVDSKDISLPITPALVDVEELPALYVTEEDFPWDLMAEVASDDLCGACHSDQKVLVEQKSCYACIAILGTRWALKMRSELSALKESAREGFDEAWAKQQDFMDSAVYSTSDETREKYVRHIANAMWSAGLASLIPKVKAIRKEALQEAVEAVKGERLECHAQMIAVGAATEAGVGDEGYSEGINDAESAILAKIEEVKR